VSLELDEHRQYLADRARLDAFERALAATVRPGDVVLDLASGTGVLGFLACRAGASRVYAIDSGSIVGLAREIARANDLNGRVSVIRQHSEWVRLPEPVDVIVTDQIGQLGFNAGLHEFLIDARLRLAKPAVRLLPKRVELWFAPCQSDAIRAAVDFWNQPVAGFDFSPAARIAQSTGYARIVTADDLLATPVALATTDFSHNNPELINGATVFTFTRAGRLDALAGWFRAELAPDVWMTNGPVPTRINRHQTLLPVERGVDVAAGERLHVRVRIRPTSNIVAWTMDLCGRDGARRLRVQHSTFEGMLVSAEDLERSNPRRAPRLSRAGTIRKHVLELCDGMRPLGSIENAVYDANADFFSSRSAAAQFVAEVLLRYAE